MPSDRTGPPRDVVAYLARRSGPARGQRIVFARTQAGNAETVAPARRLSPAVRRVLMVIDGRRSLGDLADFTRAGELDEAIDTLLEGGLIEPTGILESSGRHDRRQDTDREEALLEALKQTLQGRFEQVLGIDGRVLEARIADSVSLLVLKRVLREGIDRVVSVAGEETARSIISLVRPLFAARRVEIDRVARPIIRPPFQAR